MTGFRLTPDSAITGIKKEINNKSECGALASSFGVRRRFFFVRFIIVNIIFTEILLALLHNDMPYELSYNCMDINVTMKLPPPVLDWSQLILVLWRNNQLGGEALGLDHVVDKCVQLAIPFICENPLRSWMWSTTFLVSCRRVAFFRSSTVACMEDSA